MLFYEYLAQRANKQTIEALGAEVGLLEFEGRTTTPMARELYDFARRRQRMAPLFHAVNQRSLGIDLSIYYYELVVTYCDENGAKAVWNRLGLDSNVVFGWDFDDFLKRTTSEALQNTLAAQNRLSELLYALEELIPNLRLDFLLEPEMSGAEPPGPDNGGGREAESGEKGIELAPEWGEEMEESGPSPAEPVELRLDVAVPEQVELDRSFQVAVAVRPLESPKLVEADLGQTVSGGVQINWPELDRPIRLRVQISAPDCQIHGQDSHSFSLFPGQESPVFYFQLTPKIAGNVGIVVTLFQEEDWIGSARVHTEAQETVAGQVEVKIEGYEMDRDDSRRPTPTIEFEDFDIHVGNRRAEDNKYPVQVLGTPLGIRMVNDPELVEFPVSDPSYLRPIQHLRGLVARLDDAKSLGDGLRDLLFPGRVWDLYRRSLDKVKRENKGMRIRLQIDDQASELGIFPWEYAYYPEDNYFLALGRATPIVRYIERSYEAQSLLADRPRVLVAIASPEDEELAQLDQAGEVTQIEHALNNLGYPLDWDLLTEATLDRLQKKLKDGYDILHFIGHGLQNEETDAGLLAFEDDHGLLEAVSHERLSVVLRDTGVKLVVLAACQTAVYAEGDIFKGVAQALVQAEIPAVIAMQFVVEYQVAREFTRQLYYYLASGMPLDRALTEARISAFGRRGDYVSWGIPVLFMQSADGVIWQPPQNPVARAAASQSERLSPPGRTGTTTDPDPQPTVINQYFYGNVGEVSMGDEIVHGDKVGGDKVAGSKAGRDAINISDVSGSTIAIDGDAAAGDMYNAGRDLHIHQPEPAAAELLQLLQSISQEMAAVRNEFSARNGQEITDDLAELQQEVTAEKPDGAWIIRKLENVTAIAGAVTAAAELMPRLQQAAEMAQSLFGG